jgi:hypothetical protein
MIFLWIGIILVCNAIMVVFLHGAWGTRSKFLGWLYSVLLMLGVDGLGLLLYNVIIVLLLKSGAK